jgi:hypothetical protein
MNEYEACLDGCDDSLRKELGYNYKILKSTGSDHGYGHHSYNTIYQTETGKIISAECGGCSCEGSGSWCYTTLYEAGLMIPEQERNND